MEINNYLQRPEAYSHPVDKIRIIHTAISTVFLTGKYAYKICKPVNFGFLDFTTLEQRRQSCEKEVAFNRLISPELYEGVVAIRKHNGSWMVAGSDGRIIEYAIKMKQCNPDTTMNALLQKGEISKEQITLLARKIYQFHAKAPCDEAITQYGSTTIIKQNWEENFVQTEDAVDRVISHGSFCFIKEKIAAFIQQNERLFASRMAQQKIKHCHGDLHSGNIFIEQNELLIFDGIVFNKRFPCSDVIADIAFMAMDLDFYEKPELAKTFIATYQALSSDEDISGLLHFYKCYRAYVKGKINYFMLKDENIPAEKKKEIKQHAEKYFMLAREYAEQMQD